MNKNFLVLTLTLYETHRLHNMADKKDEGKETQEKETKKTEEKEPELVRHKKSCNAVTILFQIFNDSVVFS